MANRRALSVEEKWRLAIAILLTTTLAAPLIIGYQFYFPFVVPRNIFFRVVVEIAAALAAGFVLFERKRVVLRGEWIFWAFAGFTLAAALSAAFSPARNHSFFGDFERMGGVWAWIHLTVFLLLLRTLRDADWKRLLVAQIVISVLVSANTIVEHAGIRALAPIATKLGSDDSSTLGNPGLLAAYLLFGVGIAAFVTATEKRFRPAYLAAALINAVGLMFAENRSSVIGLIAGSVVGGILYATLAGKSRRRWIAPGVALAAAFALAALTIIVREDPGNRFTKSIPGVVEKLALTNPAEPDPSRMVQWRAALDGFRERPLFGYGLENHNLVWSAHFDPSIYSIGTDIFDRTHNQFLELLATTGIVGTLAFLCIWVAISFALVRGYRERRISLPGLAILAGLQVAYIIYLTFWFVDLNSTMLWVVVAALIATLANPLTMIRPVGVGQRESRVIPWAGAIATAALLVMLLDLEAYRPLRIAYALAAIESPDDGPASTYPQFELASQRGGGQTSHTPFVFADYLGGLAPSYEEIREDPDDRRLLDAEFQRAMEAFRMEIHRDTLNDRLYTHEASLLMDAAQFYHSDTLVRAAITALQKAIELSPRRIQQRIELSDALLEQHDTLGARTALADAISADPELGEPRYRLATLYLARGKLDSASALMQSSLRLGYVGAPETYLAVGKRLEFSGHGSTAAAIYAGYLEAKYSKAVWEQSNPIEKSVPAGDVAVAAHLPLVYVRAQESELAIKSAAALALFDPSQARVVDRFVSDVGARRRRSWLARTSLLTCENPRSRIARDSLSVGACAVLRRKL